MPAPYQASDIAAWFLGNIDREAGDAMTHLKLQKLIYYAQAWSLALRETALFEEDMQAWTHGPVAESVYQIYRHARADALPAPEVVPEIDADDEEHLSTILATYGDFRAKHLEKMTHAELPWREARKGLPDEAWCREPISKATMARFYRELYEQNEDERSESA